MKRKHATSVIGLALALSLLSGCLWAPELDRVRKDIEDQIPGAEFKKDFALSLGPVSLGFARLVTGFVPDAHEARGYLEEIRSVKVAIYEAKNIPADVSLRMPSKLQHLLEKNGWELAIKAKERDESVWILFRTKGDAIRDMYIVVLDEEELVLVRAGGRLDKLFEKAMNEHLDLKDDLGIHIN